MYMYMWLTISHITKSWMCRLYFNFCQLPLYQLHISSSFTLSTHFVSIELMQWEVDKVTNDSLGSYQICNEQYALRKNSNLYTKLIRVASLKRHRKMWMLNLGIVAIHVQCNIKHTKSCIYLQILALQNLLKQSLSTIYYCSCVKFSFIYFHLEQNHHHLLPSEYQHLSHSVHYEEEKLFLSLYSS